VLVYKRLNWPTIDKDEVKSIWLTKSSRAVAQAVSSRPLAAESRVQSHVSPCSFRGGRSGSGTVSRRCLGSVPLLVCFSHCSMLIIRLSLTLYNLSN
jgi:hypothetical protein